MKDSLTNSFLIAIGVTILGAIVLVCLPARNGLLKDGFAGFSTPKSIRHTTAHSARPQVSYHRAEVRQTLDLPWAR